MFRCRGGVQIRHVSFGGTWVSQVHDGGVPGEKKKVTGDGHVPVTVPLGPHGQTSDCSHVTCDGG